MLILMAQAVVQPPTPVVNYALSMHTVRITAGRQLLAFAVLMIGALNAAPVRAGLYYSGEAYVELPSQWRGFLLDQRTLRNMAVKGTVQTPDSPARTHYLDEAARLEKKRTLTADEIADLGAIYVRLGETGKAIELLRPAQRAHPNHFYIAANLGTAWQLSGDLGQAIASLEQAVRLAPGKYLQAEEYHLKLVRLRAEEKKGGLDDLFGIRYVNDRGEYEAGRLAAAEKKKLPTKAVAVAQRLALWLPADGALLWQLAELANAHSDIKNAAAMMDGCVTQFGLNDSELRRHRRIVRAAADELAKSTDAIGPHETKHTGTLAFRSKRPLLSHVDEAALPPISATGVNALPWELFAETTLDKNYRPTFPKYLRELAGKQVSLNGFMQPLRNDADAAAFLFIEYPVGCWYCEMPETTGIVYVELSAGTRATLQRGLVRVTGRLTLNASDPEDFLYAIRDARVGGVD
jgi:tetratricopeptide (TPR) repeat protein